MELNKLYFAKIRKDAITPSKEDENAGYDIYPNFEEDYIFIPPGKTMKIPTGIACAFSKDYVFILKERSSTGILGIGQRSGVIDSGYRGEILVPITNHTDMYICIAKTHVLKELNTLSIKLPLIILDYKKAICQGILTIVPKVETEEISYEELLKFKSKRGVGREGSTNK